MGLSKEFYKKLYELDRSNPIGLRAYDMDHPEILELRALANGSVKEEVAKVKKDNELIPWGHIDNYKLFSVRQELGIRLYEMAQLTGIDRFKYNRIERGLEQVKVSELDRIAEMLGREPEDFLIKAYERGVSKMNVDLKLLRAKILEYQYPISEIAELMELKSMTLHRKVLGVTEFTKPQVEFLEDLFFMEPGELIDNKQTKAKIANDRKLW